jgi:hypothetical protein
MREMMHRVGTLLGGLAVAGTLAALGGCGWLFGPAPATNGGPISGEIVLQVRNNHWNDINIFVLHDGVAERVGMVIAVSSTVITLRPSQVGSSGVIRLRADVIGSDETVTTENLPVRSGSTIDWTLESQLVRSHVGVW